MYLYRSLGLWAGDVARGDEFPKFGTVLAKVTDEALRRLKIGDFWRDNSCGKSFVISLSPKTARIFTILFLLGAADEVSDVGSLDLSCIALLLLLKLYVMLLAPLELLSLPLWARFLVCRKRQYDEPVDFNFGENSSVDSPLNSAEQLSVETCETKTREWGKTSFHALIIRDENSTTFCEAEICAVGMSQDKGGWCGNGESGEVCGEFGEVWKLELGEDVVSLVNFPQIKAETWWICRISSKTWIWSEIDHSRMWWIWCIIFRLLTIQVTSSSTSSLANRGNSTFTKQ
jgi:hypothetical protein